MKNVKLKPSFSSKFDLLLSLVVITQPEIQKKHGSE